MRVKPSRQRSTFESRATRIVLLGLAAAIFFGGSATARQTGSTDERPAFDATLFIGSAIDNFAAGELQRYLNPDASSEVRTFERATGGIQFSYRLPIGHATESAQPQWWIYGWTVHGVRSADVDCAANPSVSVCKGFEEETDPSGRFLYIVRNASTLEAAVGARWEPWAIGRGGVASSRFFLSLQAGFLTVSGTGEDVIDQHHVGGGLVLTSGTYKESYLELGYGRTELFALQPDSRWKVNAMLSWSPDGRNGDVRAFARILVDADFGSGADSIQSYFGLRFRLASLFAKR